MARASTLPERLSAAERGARARAGGGSTVVHGVTTDPPSLADDQNERMRKYLVAMLIRTFSFAGGVLLILLTTWDVVGWVLMGLSTVLPYIAVVIANATRRTRLQEVGTVVPPTRQLGG